MTDERVVLRNENNGETTIVADINDKRDVVLTKTERGADYQAHGVKADWKLYTENKVDLTRHELEKLLAVWIEWADKDPKA